METFSEHINPVAGPAVPTKPRKLTLTKYTIYTTNQRMYIVGSNNRETMFRIMEIDLTSPDKLSIIEENVFFTRIEIMDVLAGLEESSEGGLNKKLTGVGLLGFIRFTENYYLNVITKCSIIGILGGHHLFHIDGTQLVPVCAAYKSPDKSSEEARYLNTFQNLDLTKTFYYSHTYDMTNTLQVNFFRNKKQAMNLSDGNFARNFEYNEKFVWNASLLNPVIQVFDRVYDWFQPIIHGFVDQAKISIFDEQIYITLIARRSHHFAGARFLKRGVNDQGNVANEVETEQIVSDMLTTSFHDAKGGFYNNPRYTSFVQHRGSIPLCWSQENTNIKLAKPPIEINIVDPFYVSAALHFDDLLRRYGSPIMILNLIKQREKTPRETKLLKEFENCITYLNKFLPQGHKLQYTAWDMSRASKAHGQDVIEWLEAYAENTLNVTGIFHNGPTLLSTELQQGICRTNCIDCLDRTNAAQFVIGKKALGHQLFALGVIDKKELVYDSDVVDILTEMFHDHGDTIALQYGGSHLVNTMETYRKINQWSSHSRDMIESIKRFYSNSFVDQQRQEAINLFLGNYVWEKGIPMLWDLNTDYYLHNDFVGANIDWKPSYTHWYTDDNLYDFKGNLIEEYEIRYSTEDIKLKELLIPKVNPYAGCFDNYWNECYKPRELTSLKNVFEFSMNSTLQYGSEWKDEVVPEKEEHSKKILKSISPFQSRKPQLVAMKTKNRLLREETQQENSPEQDFSFEFGKAQSLFLFARCHTLYQLVDQTSRAWCEDLVRDGKVTVIEFTENKPTSVGAYLTNRSHNSSTGNTDFGRENIRLDDNYYDETATKELERHSLNNEGALPTQVDKTNELERLSVNNQEALPTKLDKTKDIELYSSFDQNPQVEQRNLDIYTGAYSLTKQVPFVGFHDDTRNGSGEWLERSKTVADNFANSNSDAVVKEQDMKCYHTTIDLSQKIAVPRHPDGTNIISPGAFPLDEDGSSSFISFSEIALLTSTPKKAGVGLLPVQG